MALTTRFISSPNAPFAPNPNKMDPGAASMAARAAEAGAATITRALGDLAATVDQKAGAVDDLYATKARGDLEIDYNKEFMKSAGQVAPNGDFGTESLQRLQQLAQPYIENAPNDATRKALIKSFTSLGNSARKQADTLQFNANERFELEDLNNYAQKASALTALGQAGEQKVYAELEQRAAALIEKGYDAQKIQRQVEGATQQVYLQSRLTEATNNPFRVLEAAEKGAYADKGQEVQSHIIKAANATIKGHIGTAKNTADKLLEQIYAGKPAEDSIVDQLNQMETLVTKTKDPELTQKYVELATAQRWDQQTRNLSIPELEQELLRVAKGAALGNVSPDQAKKFEGVLKNRIDWAKNDSFAYYQLQNPTAPISPLPTPNDDQQTIQNKLATRAASARAASELQGVPVPPVTGAELSAVFQNWDKLSLAQQQKQLSAFAFDPEFTPAIADLASKVIKDSGSKQNEALVPALNLMNLNPAAAMDILKGTEKLNKKVVSITLDGNKAQDILSKTLGTLYLDDPSKRSQYLEAGKAIAANKLAEDPSRDPVAEIKAAIESVSGVVEVGGSWFSSGTKIVPPEYGITSDTMENILKSVTPQNLATYSNGIPQVEDSKGNRVMISEDDLQDFQYVHVRGGKYKLVAGDSTVLNDKGETLIFDMRSYFKDNKSTLQK